MSHGQHECLNLFGVDRHVHPAAASLLHELVATTIEQYSSPPLWSQREPEALWVPLISPSVIAYIDRAYPAFKNLEREEIVTPLREYIPSHGWDTIYPAVAGVNLTPSANPRKPGCYLNMELRPDNQIREEEMAVKGFLHHLTGLEFPLDRRKVICLGRAKVPNPQVEEAEQVRRAISKNVAGLKIPLLLVNFFFQAPDTQ